MRAFSIVANIPGASVVREKVSELRDSPNSLVALKSVFSLLRLRAKPFRAPSARPRYNRQARMHRAGRRSRRKVDEVGVRGFQPQRVLLKRPKFDLPCTVSGENFVEAKNPSRHRRIRRPPQADRSFCRHRSAIPAVPPRSEQPRSLCRSELRYTSAERFECVLAVIPVAFPADAHSNREFRRQNSPAGLGRIVRSLADPVLDPFLNQGSTRS